MKKPKPWICLLLLVAGQCVCAAQGPVKLPEFAVASVRPNKSADNRFRMAFSNDGVTLVNASVLMIIRAAYGMFNSLDDKFLGIPAWATTEKFDLEARVDPADADTFRKLNFDQKQRLVQALLADRFRLQAHQEIQQQPVYTLAIAKGGAKLRETKPVAEGEQPITMNRTRGRIVAQSAVISQLVSVLTQTLDRTVQDKTGLAGKYDFTLVWAPDDEAGAEASAGPSIFTALQEQLGLKLESTTGPVECLVIDHVERPSEN